MKILSKRHALVNSDFETVKRKKYCVFMFAKQNEKKKQKRHEEEKKSA